MKNIIFLIALLVTVSSQAQNVSVPKRDGNYVVVATASDSTKRNTDSINTKLATRDSNNIFTPFSKWKPINLFYGDTTIIFGDSYGVASGATNSSYGWVAIVNSATNTVANNLAVGARGAKVAALSAYTNVSPVGNTHPTFWAAGLNDFRRMGSNTVLDNKTAEKVKSCLRATIANNNLASAVAANNASVTTAGTWGTTSGIGDKASSSLGGLVRTSSVSGSTLTYTFTGNNIVIGTFSTDEVTTTGGNWSYSIDAGIYTGSYTGKNKTDGISDGVTDNSICPNAVVVTGLGSGSHTIVITTTENLTARIDYFGILQAEEMCNPFIIASTPKMTATGYAALNGSDALWNRCDSVLQIIPSEFYNYPVYYVDINKFYDRSNGVSSDSIHPNNTGYQQISKAFLERINSNSGVKMSNLGRVGIGTTNPKGQFQITDEAGTNVYRGLLITSNISSTVAPYFATNKSRGTLLSPTAVTSGDFTGVFDFWGYVGGTNTYQIGSRISSIVNGTPTDAVSGLPADIVFSNSNGTTFKEAFRIHNSGRIGIGTAAPAWQLQITDSSASSTHGLLITESNTSATSNIIGFQKSRGTPNAPTAVTTADFLGFTDYRGYVGGTNTYQVGARISAIVDGTVTDATSGVPAYVAISTSNGTTFSEKVRITPAGVTNLFKGANVASASAIVPLGNVFHVTGTTNITSITSTSIIAGTTITIIFDGVLTFTDGSNLKLAGDFVTTADDTITLVYDGTNWYEKSRSVN